MQTHTFVHHRDIQNWVADHHGQPAIRRVPDKFGSVHARLTLNFPKHKTLHATPSQDDGLSPVSWSAWLAELDRQNLALKVADQQLPAFELVERKDLN